MALSCDPKTIMAGADCLVCDLSHKQLLAGLVYVLCQANNMNCAPATLMSGSKCILCLTEKQLLAAAVYLLCTGGSGGGGSAPAGAGFILQDATGGPPPDPTRPWLSFPTGGGGISEWDVASQTWI